MLVSLEADNNSHEPGEFRAIAMHQFRDNGELIIECREGVFNQSLILQRGVIFSYMTFGSVSVVSQRTTDRFGSRRVVCRRRPRAP